ncbi:MAG: FtsX-like permease family protein [Spirochaetes bacterium]|nr:FtsX-like permease family protein [Spirochaetota bacterium]
MSSSKINLLDMAYRNLGRHKVKSIITIIAIFISVFLLIWMDSWVLGMKIDSKRNLVNFETGAAKIYTKAYYENKDELPLYEGFDQYQFVIDQLAQAGYKAAPKAAFAGTLISKDQEVPFQFWGIDPKLSKNLFLFEDFIESGSFIANGVSKIVLGVRGAQDLNVRVGDTLRLTTTIDTKDEIGKIHHTHQVIDLIVGGIINSPNPIINGKLGLLPLDILQDEMGILLQGHVSELCIRKLGALSTDLPGKKETPEAILANMAEPLPDHLTLVSWEEDAKDFLAMAAGDTYGTYVIIGFLMILAIAGIANTMLMAVLERTKEIGMVRALGLTDGQVTRLYIYESMLIGLIGGALGLITASLFNYFYMIPIGIDLTAMLEEGFEDGFGYRVTGITRSAWNYGMIAGSFIGSVLVAGLMALIPVKKALKIAVSDALRFE